MSCGYRVVWALHGHLVVACHGPKERHALWLAQNRGATPVPGLGRAGRQGRRYRLHPEQECCPGHQVKQALVTLPGVDQIVNNHILKLTTAMFFIIPQKAL